MRNENTVKIEASKTEVVYYVRVNEQLVATTITLKLAQAYASAIRLALTATQTPFTMIYGKGCE